MDVSKNAIEVIVFFYEKVKSKAGFWRKKTVSFFIPKNINLVKIKKMFW